MIAIIGILAAILIPVAGKARESSYSARCFSNLRTIHSWLTSYAAENKGAYPAVYPASKIPWWTALQAYVETSRSALVQDEGGEALRFWYCPAAANTFPEEPHRVYPINCYGLPQATPIRPLQSSQPARTLLLADGAYNPGGGGNSLSYFRNATANAAERPSVALEARHLDKVNGMFLDGHISVFPLSEPQLETWITNLGR